MGVKRTIQMPGMGILTMPGYAFHFTVSQGFNLAESCNMFLEVMGWTFEKLWKVGFCCWRMLANCYWEAAGDGGVAQSCLIVSRAYAA